MEGHKISHNCLKFSHFTKLSPCGKQCREKFPENKTLFLRAIWGQGENITFRLYPCCCLVGLWSQKLDRADDTKLLISIVCSSKLSKLLELGTVHHDGTYIRPTFTNTKQHIPTITGEENFPSLYKARRENLSYKVNSPADVLGKYLTNIQYRPLRYPKTGKQTRQWTHHNDTSK